MVKCFDFQNREFKSKEERNEALVVNKNELIALKKRTIVKGVEKSTSFGFVDSARLKNANKGSLPFDVKSDFIYPVISTTNFFDSHGDVHIKGSMTKTANEQNGNVVYALDHELRYDSILAWEKDVNMFIAEIPWGLVGKNYDGVTQGLIFEINKNAIRNQQVIKDINDNVKAFQNSIRMQYFKLALAVNSQDSGMKEELATYETYFDSIANKSDVEKSGYFWAVQELGIYKEGSLVVAGGSNSATSIITENDIEPLQDTQTNDKVEPLVTNTRRLKLTDFIN